MGAIGNLDETSIQTGSNRKRGNNNLVIQGQAKPYPRLSFFMKCFFRSASCLRVFDGIFETHGLPAMR